jgi:uncharacterized protein (TIGR03084 family)
VDDILSALADQQAELSDLLVDLDDEGWQRPSACDGWTVADVVLHLAQTNEMAVGSATHRFDEVIEELTSGLGAAGNVDDGAALMVQHQRGRPPNELFARWRSGAQELLGVLAASDPHQRVTWVAGQLSIHTLGTTRLAETWIHTGDVAIGLDHELVPTERLRHVARLAWRTIPYAMAGAGRELSAPVAFHLRGTDGSSWDFVPDEEPGTVITGDGVELCLVAARRVDASATSLRGEGPDADSVLELVRTYA